MSYRECEAMQTRYRYTVCVQSPKEDATAGAGGHPDLTDDANWQDEGTIRVRFISRGGREGRIFDRVQGEVSHILETPSTGFSRCITPLMRLVLGTKKYNIVAAYDKDEDRRVIQIQTTEVV